MVDLEITVKRHKKIPSAVKMGFKRGQMDAGEWLLEEGEDRAKDAIMSADRIWREKLKEGFEQEDMNGLGRVSGWTGELKNTAPHAEHNETGMKPGNSPPVQNLAPWIDDQIGASLPSVTTTSYNVNNWDPDLQSLAAEYSPGIVITAFAVQDKLEKEGYSGIGFMETTENYLQRVGPAVVKHKVEKHLRREIRESRLS